MIIEITDVYCSYWHWVYINGRCVNRKGEGHSFNLHKLSNVINDYLKVHAVVESIKYHDLEISDEYARQCGNYLPHRLTDIPKEAETMFKLKVIK